MNRKKILQPRRKNNAVVPLVIISVAVVFSAALAGIWQLNSPKIEVLSPLVLDPSVTGQFSYPDAPQPDASSSSSAAPSVPPDETIGGEPASSNPDLEVLAPSAPLGILPGQPRVTSSYFDDAVFIGDSLTVGIKHYEVMSNAAVFASTGVGLENIFTKQAVKQDGKDVTILDALSAYPAKKVYIMLGANSLMSNYDYLLGQYARLVDEVIARTAKDAVIYVQSVLPVNEPLFHVKYAPNTTTNADIDRFNTMLCDMAGQKGVYYLDVASAFKDENNSMPSANTPDGMHIISSQYIIWFDYLKEHAVQ